MDDNITSAIWQQVDAMKESESPLPSLNKQTCSNCNGSKIGLCHNGGEIVCYDCGLVLQTNMNDSMAYSNPDAYPEPNKARVKHDNSKLSKMQDWYMWSNEEKNTYKLTTYTKELCSRVGIHENLYKGICDTVVIVMDVIKKYDGTKRARVKDGIIISCIAYVTSCVSAVDLAKRINLDIKYITKAEKLMLEMINTGKLKLDKNIVHGIKRPFTYVQDVVRKNCLKIPDSILKRVALLIDVCEMHDLLLDHTPLSVGVCCFYYVLKCHEIATDIKMFSDLYDLSIVTVVKTFNKLKTYKEILSEYEL
jgi:transcription initiation factor TFIIIB Brf1 subunit/transcription initiation factor TFIIB